MFFEKSAQGDDSVIELTGRSPVLSVQQDTFSALCAMYLSGAIDNQDCVRLVTRYNDKYAEALIDQVKQTSISVTQGTAPDQPTSIILAPAVTAGVGVAAPSAAYSGFGSSVAAPANVGQ